ncbi:MULTISPECIES: CYTH domain-containing protein [unclassified Thermosynechococcus]|uniref:CYTH domain-containing protein n=1 Tax=unclassified Thermosynechococcus TaxID=2622553 RepID=UPI001A028B57|nr:MULTISPECIES: CYTH domain-containing protein [unclassified Thermosynechococcus]HIK35878.1 CYTH domain-containing protein [Thermosynechococcus sp. M98_K2018_005]HIK47600.1 CYTH domain-containing protein [Thermosynechococcus sp. M55_K2018_012]
MGIEIERKFLVRGEEWRSLATSVSQFAQGYLSTVPERTVRVRLAGDKAWITIKGKASGGQRREYEYTIPVADARELLAELCLQPIIKKNRYRIPAGDLCWEVDEFTGACAGLILAEIELPRADYPLTLPPWIGLEVTDDPRYTNAYLAEHPYQKWVTGNS